jgi:hypothetical protein
MGDTPPALIVQGLSLSPEERNEERQRRREVVRCLGLLGSWGRGFIPTTTPCSQVTATGIRLLADEI